MIAVFSFVVVAWLASILTAWCFDYLPEIYYEWRKNKARKWAEAMNEVDHETTVEMPGGSFDPDETMQLSVKKIRDRKTKEVQVVFVARTNSPILSRRRHAKT